MAKLFYLIPLVPATMMMCAMSYPFADILLRTVVAVIGIYPSRVIQAIYAKKRGDEKIEGIQMCLNYLVVLHVVFAPSVEIAILHSVVGCAFFVLGVMCIVLATDEDLVTMNKKRYTIVNNAMGIIFLMMLVMFCLSTNGFLYFIVWGFGLSVMSAGVFRAIGNIVGEAQHRF